MPTDSPSEDAPRAIVVAALTRTFGPKLAVDRLSFSIGAGEVVGLVGPNGAGKTTLLRLLTGVLPPSSGTASICGLDVGSATLEVKRRVGFAPESAAVFESLSAMEYLEIVAGLYGVPPALARERIFRLAALFDIETDVLTRHLLGTYSKGMRRKVIIAAALLHNPSVLFFDEPLDGLDPTAALAFKSLIRALAGEGKTIVYAGRERYGEAQNPRREFLAGRCVFPARRSAPVRRLRRKTARWRARRQGAGLGTPTEADSGGVPLALTLGKQLRGGPAQVFLLLGEGHLAQAAAGVYPPTARGGDGVEARDGVSSALLGGGHGSGRLEPRYARADSLARDSRH
ncbi:MAG: ABC transporter ATP-binding protein [Opitutaceae bacterium]